MTKVCSIDRREYKGITESYIATLSEEGRRFTAFIKLKNNPEGDRFLINELVSYRLTKLLGILMPVSGVADISADTRDNTFEVDIQENRGSCFYSTMVSHALY